MAKNKKRIVTVSSLALATVTLWFLRSSEAPMTPYSVSATRSPVISRVAKFDKLDRQRVLESLQKFAIEHDLKGTVRPLSPDGALIAFAIERSGILIQGTNVLVENEIEIGFYQPIGETQPKASTKALALAITLRLEALGGRVARRK